MSINLNIDRIAPDMHVDENGKIVWTPRLIDYKTYYRGHTIKAEEFNTELLKQTYQGNYNTDTISVLIGLYNDLNADVTQKTNTANTNASEALRRVVIAEANSTEALSTANAAFETSNNAFTEATSAVNTSISAKTIAENSLNISESAMSLAEDSSDRADNALNIANEAIEIAETADSVAVFAKAESAEAKSISETANTNSTNALNTAKTANTNSVNAVNTANTALNTANTADTNADTALSTANTALENSKTAMSTANTALSNSSTALSNSSDAVTKSNTALSNSTTAVSTSNTANTNAAEALEKATEALTKVTQGLGTQVKVAGELVSTWNADTKLDKAGGTMSGTLELTGTYPHIKHASDLCFASETNIFRFGNSSNANSVAVLASGSYNTFRPASNNLMDIGTSDRRWKNGYFAGTVTATTFSGNATSATKATQDSDGNVIKDTYVKQSTITDHKSIGSLDRDGGWNNSSNLATINTLAFWNGAYDLANNSNLKYCHNGEILGTKGGQTINGNLTIAADKKLINLGNAADASIVTRGIQGANADGTDGDLHLQNGKDYAVKFGKTSVSTLNSDGSISLNGTYPQIKTDEADFVIKTGGGQEYDFTNTEFRPTQSYANTLSIGKTDRRFKQGWFSGDITTSGTNLNIQDTGTAYTEDLPSTSTAAVRKSLYFTDKNNAPWGAVEIYKNNGTNAARRMQFNLRNKAGTWMTSKEGTLSMSIASDGTSKTFAAAPSLDANDTRIATTAWVRDSTDITGVQTDIVTLVKGLINTTDVTKSAKYARWYCRINGTAEGNNGSFSVKNIPLNVAFVCEALCTRLSTATDYSYTVRFVGTANNIIYRTYVNQASKTFAENSNTNSLTWIQDVINNVNQTIYGVKTFGAAPKISASLASTLNDTTVATTKWVKSLATPNLTDTTEHTYNGNAVIVKSWISSDKNTWYRVWSDGFKECWHTRTKDWTYAIWDESFTFPVAFTDATHYYANVSYSATGLEASDAAVSDRTRMYVQSWSAPIYSRTNAKVQFIMRGGTSIVIYACGY